MTIKNLRKTGGDFTNLTAVKNWVMGQCPFTDDVTIQCQGGQAFGLVDGTPGWNDYTTVLTWDTAAGGASTLNGHTLKFTTHPSELATPGRLDCNFSFETAGTAPESGGVGAIIMDKLILRSFANGTWDAERLLTTQVSCWRASLLITNCLIYTKNTATDGHQLFRVYFDGGTGVPGLASSMVNSTIILGGTGPSCYTWNNFPFEDVALNDGVCHNCLFVYYTAAEYSIGFRFGVSKNNTFYNYGGGNTVYVYQASGSDVNTIAGTNPHTVDALLQAPNESFVLVGARDAHLTAASAACLNNADLTVAPAVDIYGNPR